MPKSALLFSILILALVLPVAAGCVKTSNQEGSIISEEESLKIAINFVQNSPTFKFDGMKNTLKLVSSAAQEKPHSWQFEYEFKCRHAGYGDRSGKMLAQVITSHKAQIVVQEGEVIYAVLDGKWDMMNQKMIEEQD